MNNVKLIVTLRYIIRTLLYHEYQLTNYKTLCTVVNNTGMYKESTYNHVLYKYSYLLTYLLTIVSYSVRTKCVLLHVVVLCFLEVHI